MKINEKGVDTITRFEGFSSEPYMCPANVPTIGYGSTFYEDGTKVSLEDKPITEASAREALRIELIRVEGYVQRLVLVDLTENEFSALVSFVYNVGSGNFQRSTMRMKLNRGDKAGAAEEFWKWRRGGGRILPGLVRRREVEKSLFLLV